MSQSMPPDSGRVYGGVSQDERKAIRRQQFLAAGLEVFGTEGFRAATVRRLCAEARLTDRYFYQSCGSLESLLTDVYEQCMGQIRSSIEAAISDAQPGSDEEQLIHRALDAFFRALEDSRVARVCMVELEGISPEVDQLYHGYIRGFAELIVSLAQRVHPDWAMSDEESQVLGIALVGAMRQVATDWLLGGYSIDRETVVKATARMMLGLSRQIESEQR